MDFFCLICCAVKCSRPPDLNTDKDILEDSKIQYEYILCCIEDVLYWLKYPILIFLDKWHHKVLNGIDQDFRQQ